VLHSLGSCRLLSRLSPAAAVLLLASESSTTQNGHSAAHQPPVHRHCLTGCGTNSGWHDAAAAAAAAAGCCCCCRLLLLLLLLRAPAAGRCLYWCPSLSAAAAAAHIQPSLRDAQACSILECQLHSIYKAPSVAQCCCCCCCWRLVTPTAGLQLQEGLRCNLSLLPSTHRGRAVDRGGQQVSAGGKGTPACFGIGMGGH
jgi:hypothetical protein